MSLVFPDERRSYYSVRELPRRMSETLMALCSRATIRRACRSYRGSKNGHIEESGLAPPLRVGLAVANPIKFIQHGIQLLVCHLAELLNRIGRRQYDHLHILNRLRLGVPCIDQHLRSHPAIAPLTVFGELPISGVAFIQQPFQVSRLDTCSLKLLL